MSIFKTARQWLKQAAFNGLKRLMKPIVLGIVNNEIRVWGPRSRLTIAPTAQMVNTLFNTSSGSIEIGDHSFAGHNVSVITGTHHYDAFLQRRLVDIPRQGRDVVIGRGVWLGSHSVVLGPCTIGDHAVVASGAVVVAGSVIAPGTIVAGVPARPIKTIDLSGLTDT